MSQSIALQQFGVIFVGANSRTQARRLFNSAKRKGLDARTEKDGKGRVRQFIGSDILKPSNAIALAKKHGIDVLSLDYPTNSFIPVEWASIALRHHITPDKTELAITRVMRPDNGDKVVIDNRKRVKVTNRKSGKDEEIRLGRVFDPDAQPGDSTPDYLRVRGDFNVLVRDRINHELNVSIDEIDTSQQWPYVLQVYVGVRSVHGLKVIGSQFLADLHTRFHEVQDREEALTGVKPDCNAPVFFDGDYDEIRKILAGSLHADEAAEEIRQFGMSEDEWQRFTETGLKWMAERRNLGKPMLFLPALLLEDGGRNSQSRFFKTGITCVQMDEGDLREAYDDITKTIWAWGRAKAHEKLRYFENRARRIRERAGEQPVEA